MWVEESHVYTFLEMTYHLKRPIQTESTDSHPNSGSTLGKKKELKKIEDNTDTQGKETEMLFKTNTHDVAHKMRCHVATYPISSLWHEKKDLADYTR